MNPSTCTNTSELYLHGNYNSVLSMDQDKKFDMQSDLLNYNTRILQRPQYYSSATDLSVTESASSVEKGFKGNKIKEKGKSVKQIDGVMHLNPPQYRIQNDDEATLNVGESEDKKPICESNRGNTKDHKNKAKENNSMDGDESKEEYVHVRAKRGQATNSHSLAERVRREKISERMKLLQDLVPGCNKITGKAMMLDEIINYVQSLQRQVEFLSMKLAALSPELNFDLEQIFSKDIIHSRHVSLPILGPGPSFTNLNSNFYGFTPQGVNPMEISRSVSNPIEIQPSTVPNFPSMPQVPGFWDNELQNILHAGIFSNANPSATDNSGSMQMDD